MLALISLPSHNMPTCEGMSNLNGWWKPPIYVVRFWANACIIECKTIEYEKAKDKVIESYLESIRQFFRENAL